MVQKEQYKKERRMKMINKIKNFFKKDKTAFEKKWEYLNKNKNLYFYNKENIKMEKTYLSKKEGTYIYMPRNAEMLHRSGYGKTEKEAIDDLNKTLDFETSRNKDELKDKFIASFLDMFRYYLERDYGIPAISEINDERIRVGVVNSFYTYDYFEKTILNNEELKISKKGIKWKDKNTLERIYMHILYDNKRSNDYIEAIINDHKNSQEEMKIKKEENN